VDQNPVRIQLDIFVRGPRWHIEEEVKERIALGIKAYYSNLKFFKSRLVTKGSKLKLYRTAIRPIVTYASETWVLKENIIQKVLVFERKILKRNIWAYERKSNMED
jgi:hypothetical protein